MNEVMKIQMRGLPEYLMKRAYVRSIRRVLPFKRNGSISIMGNDLVIDRYDLQQAQLETDCVCEPENIFIYRALANSGLCNTFIDIGANYGHLALKLHQHFAKVILIEANPNAAGFLKDLFRGQSGVEIFNCAIVSDEKISTVLLMVPNQQSGFAHVATTAAGNETTHECQASTLDRLLSKKITSSYCVKIDVEGLEQNVIKSGREVLNRPGVITGFEAQSRSMAIDCCDLFREHVFYFARFDFLGRSGALTQNMIQMLGALANGGNISVYKFENMANVPMDNFSQIFAVPKTHMEVFETALYSERARLSGCVDLAKA